MTKTRKNNRSRNRSMRQRGGKKTRKYNKQRKQRKTRRNHNRFGGGETAPSLSTTKVKKNVRSDATRKRIGARVSTTIKGVLAAGAGGFVAGGVALTIGPITAAAVLIAAGLAVDEGIIKEHKQKVKHISQQYDKLNNMIKNYKKIGEDNEKEKVRLYNDILIHANNLKVSKSLTTKLTNILQPTNTTSGGGEIDEENEQGDSNQKWMKVVSTARGVEKFKDIMLDVKEDHENKVEEENEKFLQEAAKNTNVPIETLKNIEKQIADCIKKSANTLQSIPEETQQQVDAEAETPQETLEETE